MGFRNSANKNTPLVSSVHQDNTHGSAVGARRTTSRRATGAPKETGGAPGISLFTFRPCLLPCPAGLRQFLSCAFQVANPVAHGTALLGLLQFCADLVIETLELVPLADEVGAGLGGLQFHFLHAPLEVFFIRADLIAL